MIFRLTPLFLDVIQSIVSTSRYRVPGTYFTSTLPFNHSLLRTPLRSSFLEQTGPCNGTPRCQALVIHTLPCHMHALCPSPLSVTRRLDTRALVPVYATSATVMHSLGSFLRRLPDICAQYYILRAL